MSNLTTLAIDIGTSTIDAVIATKKKNGSITVLGTGTVKSEGLQKGTITNIDQLGSSIKKAVQSAKRTSDEQIKSATVSIPSSYTKTIRSSGSIIIPNGYISEHEIKKVLETAYHNASTIPEYEVIHVLPIYFKIDDVQSESPLNMTGSRLEVSASIVIAKKSALVNIANALKPSNLDIENYVLSGYASSISTLQDDEKKFGTFILDMGASSVDMTLFSGKSILYNDFLPIGSQYITNDISQTFNTPQIAAEMVKNQYATLVPFKIDDHQLTKRIRVPILGNETESNEITLDRLQPIIHARVEEMLILVYKKFIQSELSDRAMAGIVLTGGLSKLPGIKELAEKVFDNFTVKIGTIKNIQNEYMDFQDNSKSTIVGLVYYALNTIPTYQLDSSKSLRSMNINEEDHIENFETQIESTETSPMIEETSVTTAQIESKEELLVPIEKEKKRSGISGIISDIKDWF